MLTKKETIKSEVKTSKTTKSASSSTPVIIQSNSCCEPNPTTPKKTNGAATKTNSAQAAKSKENGNGIDKKNTSPKTRITVKYDAGFSNQLYIRGQGANLSWNKGESLKNVKADEWVWETEGQFTNCEFKILINDHIYENGDNHHLKVGCSLVHTPRFY